MPMMTVRMLLKSWAMPPVSWPIASIFWAWRSCCSSLHALGHVAADEEVLLVGLRPHAAPGERHDAPVLVHVAAIEIAHGAAHGAQAHLVARVVEVSGGELERSRRPSRRGGSRGWPGAGADAQDVAPPVDDHDEVERGLEQPLVDGARGFEHWRAFRAVPVVRGAGSRGLERRGVAAPAPEVARGRQSIVHASHCRRAAALSPSRAMNFDFGIGRAK